MSGRELIKVLSKAGFVAVRQKGSDVFMKHSDGRCTTVPLHDEIKRSTLGRILEQASISKEEFLTLFNRI